MAPSIKSIVKHITGKVNMSKISAAGLICRWTPPWAGPLFWQSVILPPQMVPQELQNNEPAKTNANERYFIFFMYFKIKDS
jgi:hypothetical protein